MPYSKGGETCNLITCYREGEDSEAAFGWHRQVAQSFTLSNQTAFYIFLAKLNLPWDFFEQVYTLYYADDDGMPIGAPIAQTSTWSKRYKTYPAGSWCRATFDDFPTLSPGKYAVALSVSALASWLKLKWRADSTSPTYTAGKAWRSDDAGASWYELEDTDFQFEVWGWTPPPEPPPTPVISNWAILDITFQDEVDGYTVIATSDIPCHLYMRWSATKPLTHPQAVYKRGLPLMTGTHFCFVAWHENEQVEPGDTLVHTFNKRNWPICQTRWFYFIGTKQAEEVPSASPIFSLHRTDLWIPVIIELWTREYLPQPEYEITFTEEWSI